MVERAGNECTSPDKGLLIAVTDPISPNREADYHRWYNEVQIPPFLEMPGFTRVIRYKSSATQLGAAPALPHSFVALYDIDAVGHGGLVDVADRLFAAYQLGRVGNKSLGSDAYNQQSSRSIYYAMVGERTGEASVTPNALLLVYADPEQGQQEAQDSTGHPDQHFADIVLVPGFIGATRYVITDLNVGRQFKPWPVQRRYLTVYELGAKGPAEIRTALQAMQRRAEPNRGFDMQSVESRPLAQCYERIAGPFTPGA